MLALGLRFCSLNLQQFLESGTAAPALGGIHNPNSPTAPLARRGDGWSGWQGSTALAGLLRRGRWSCPSLCYSAGQKQDGGTSGFPSTL